MQKSYNRLLKTFENLLTTVLFYSYLCKKITMYKKTTPAPRGKKPIAKGPKKSVPTHKQTYKEKTAGADVRASKKRSFGTDYNRSTQCELNEVKSAPANKETPKFKGKKQGDVSAPLRSARHDSSKRRKPAPKRVSSTEGVRLNKYIANAGICSRREADTLIESGVVRINGVICTQLGTRVMPHDKVEFGGETLISEKKVYLLMNKPKGYITTTDDPQERKTVMHLIEGACKERIYPVGRLDRQTTGVLLFTNDGEMAKKLMHPSHGARKIYHVTLDKNTTKTDLNTIAKGVELEDGFVPVDEIHLIAGTKNEIGIQLHSGMNRVVRRMFEKYDYKVVKLDRVLFAELTKKDLSRGHWRFLSEKEVNFLKMK